MDILLVEDIPEERQALEELLEEEGYEVTSAGTLTEAKKHLKRQPFPLVLLDIVLPDGDGIELLNDIDTEDTTIIVITAYGTLERAQRCIKEGVYDFITKPFTKEELLGSLKRAKERQTIKALLKAKHEALIKKERFLTSVIEAIGDAVLVIDPGFRIIRANQGFLSQTGLTSEEVSGRHCYELSHGYTRACYEEGEDCPVVKAFHDGMTHFSVHTHRRKDGSSFYVEIRAFPLKEPDGMTTSVVETITDITSSVHLQERLRQSEVRYRQLYNNTPALLVSTTTEGIIVECNDTFCRNTGYDRETLIGMAFEDLVPEPVRPEFIKKCVNLISGAEDCEGEFEVTRADGTTLSVYAKASLVRDKEGRPKRISFTLTDITALKRLQAEKEQLQLQLFQAQKMESLGKLASGIAHDFNNMLMAIGGYAEILSHSVKDPSGKKYLEGILKTVERARELTEKVLLMGRKKPPERRLIDINQFIRESFDTFKRMVEEDKPLKLVLTEGLPPVSADEGQLYQLLMNLVVNARDAISGKGIITIKTGHSPGPCLQDKPYICILQSRNQPDGGFVWFSVEDTGTGIPLEEIPKIFDPFFTTKGPQGTGLGLSIVYGIVQAHEGCIDVYSRPGQGTEVVVFLPVAEALEEKGLKREVTAKDGQVRTHVEIKRALVVDDEEVIREVLQNFFHHKGITCKTVETPEVCLETLKMNPQGYDLLVMDWVMPGLSGEELLSEAIRIAPHLKVIVTTGYAEIEGLTEAKKITEVAILHKPFKLEDLIKAISEIKGQGLKSPPSMADNTLEADNHL